MFYWKLRSPNDNSKPTIRVGKCLYLSARNFYFLGSGAIPLPSVPTIQASGYSSVYATATRSSDLFQLAPGNAQIVGEILQPFEIF